MRFSLIPREMKFFDMFDEAAAIISRAAGKFLDMVTEFDRASRLTHPAPQRRSSDRDVETPAGGHDVGINGEREDQEKRPAQRGHSHIECDERREDQIGERLCADRPAWDVPSVLCWNPGVQEEQLNCPVSKISRAEIARVVPKVGQEPRRCDDEEAQINETE